MSQADLSSPAKGFRLTGWHALAMVTTFFAIVMAVDIGMAVMAYRTFSGEVAADPYDAGLLYNRTLAERRVQAALGWTGTMDLQGGVLRVTVRDRTGQPIDGLRASATLERPATEAGKAVVALQSTGPGVYEATPAVASGAWDIRVRTIDTQGRAFEVEQRFVKP